MRQRILRVQTDGALRGRKGLLMMAHDGGVFRIQALHLGIAGRQVQGAIKFRGRPLEIKQAIGESNREASGPS
jgi:hypothetical protein